MPQIPKRNTTAPPEGRSTRIELSDILSKATVADARENQQVNMNLVQMSENMLRTADEHIGHAAEYIANIPSLDKSALAARNKSDAWQIVYDSKLLMDQQLQALSHDPEVKPLELASRADEIIKAASNDAVAEGAKLGADMRDFVRDKLGAYRVEKVPEFRREGYKQETDEMLGALDQRIFMRQAEANSAGTTPAKRMELMQENISDITSMRGVHLSDQQVQEKVEDLIVDNIKNAWFDSLPDNPRLALKTLYQIPGLSPQEREAMRGKAQGILDAEEARRDREERRYYEKLDRNSAALHDAAVEKIVRSNGEWNPATMSNDPGAMAVLRKGELEGLVKFHAWYIKQDEDRPLTLDQAFELGRLRVQGMSGEQRPGEYLNTLRHAVETGVRLPTNKVDSLLDVSSSAWNRMESVNSGEFKYNRKRGEDIIQEWFNPVQGPYAAMSDRYAAQIRMAKINAQTMYAQRMADEVDRVKEMGGDPALLINADSIAMQVLADSALATKPLYEQYISRVDNKALRSAMVPNAQSYDPAEFSRILLNERDQGRMSERELKAAMSYDRLMRSMSQLPAPSAAPNQPPVQLLGPAAQQQGGLPQTRPTTDAEKARIRARMKAQFGMNP